VCRGVVNGASSLVVAGFVIAGRTLPWCGPHISERHESKYERDIDENKSRFSPRHYNAPMYLVVSAEFAAGFTASMQIPGGSVLRPDAST
jgi:hypothetical protein